MATSVASPLGWLSWDSSRGMFVTCLARDRSGNVWVGTEDKGVWRYAPQAPEGKQWTQFGPENGLGDDTCYSLLCDRDGCVWAGTLNHGVSVFNGTDWKTYGVLEGTVGLHVIALALNPANGDVWGATEAGLFRYVARTRTWRSYGREQGLPANQANALCFDTHGNLYVGTQCDGIAVAALKDDYRQWHVATGPAQLPNVASGEGLSTSQITCLCCIPDPTSDNDIVYAGTTTGLAGTTDGGKTWRYRRGADWKEKIQGLLHPPASAASTTLSGDGLTLFEDYVTCLANGGNGHLLVGHRQQPVENIDLRTSQTLTTATALGERQAGVFATTLLPLPDQTVMIGSYGAGASASIFGGLSAPQDADASGSAIASDFPLPSPAPSSGELNALLKAASAIPVATDEMRPKIEALDDDWQTQGDWLGRYGRYWACLCGTQGNGDYFWGTAWDPVHAWFYAGPNHSLGQTPHDDGLRYWVHWVYTSNPRTLELPSPYVDNRVQAKSTTWKEARRESEVNDSAGAHPLLRDGPDVYQTLHVPPGLFYLSLYDHNKDGHSSDNSWRDYHVSVWLRDGSTLLDEAAPTSGADAHTQIRNFWGGVYKRFLVRGPAVLTLRVARNYSKNTILAGVMLDEVSETPAPYFRTPAEEQTQAALQRSAALERAEKSHQGGFEPASSRDAAAQRLFDVLDDLRWVNSSWWAANSRPYYVALGRWYLAQAKRGAGSPDLSRRIATCLYQTNQFADWENYQRQAGLTTARQIEQSLRWKTGEPQKGDFESVLLYHAANAGASGTH